MKRVHIKHCLKHDVPQLVCLIAWVFMDMLNERDFCLELVTVTLFLFSFSCVADFNLFHLNSMLLFFYINILMF